MEQLRADLTEHRLLVFHGQNELTVDDHVSLSEELGSMDHGVFRPHPKVPDSRLLRLSNKEAEGFVPGTNDWHVGGSMLQAPFSVQTMHFLSALPGEQGETAFLGLKEFVSEMEPEFLDACKRSWFVSAFGNDLLAGDGQLNLLPLVYKHPVTGDDTMCFHLTRGYCLGFVQEQPSMGALMDGLAVFLEAESEGSAYQRALRPLLGVGKDAPTSFKILAPEPIQQEIRQAINGLAGAARRRAVWHQQWEDGDLALIDNMALANLPRPPPEGLDNPDFLLHRTAMVDIPQAEIKNSRGAKAVVLKGDGRSLKEALDENSQYRYVLSGMLQVAPLDTSVAGVEARASQAIPPKEEAVRALQKGGFPLGLLDQIDMQVQDARAEGTDSLSRILRKFMLQLHPDQNPGREEIVPIFKYLRRLRVEQNIIERGRMRDSSKKSVLSKLRKKKLKVAIEPKGS